MLVTTIKALFTRDLNRLKTEILSYKNETNIWRIEKNIANSAGNLCLHLVGNLNTYIGAEIGKTNYIRQRDLEFSLKDIPKAELIIKISGIKSYSEAKLSKKEVDLDGLKFSILSKNDLIKNKLASGREKDIEDAKFLSDNE